MGNYITFGSVSSSTYGIQISGEGVFNAPERDVEMISIPGRDGEYALDHGRFKNIQVTYPAANQAADKATFISNIDSLRNALASQKGYQKLSDTFHTDEYRMAIFKDGLEVNPILYNDHSSQLDITFDCKPQRFLTSGDTKSTVANNGSLSNPTLFDSHPLLEVKGYGTLTMGGQSIVLDNSIPLGNVVVAPKSTKDNFLDMTVDLRPVLANGDTFSVLCNFFYKIEKKSTRSITGITGNQPMTIVTSLTGESAIVNCAQIVLSFTYGTTASESKATTLTINSEYNGTTYTNTKSVTTTIAYNASSQTLTFSNTQSSSDTYFKLTGQNKNMNEITAYSTASSLGNPTYIDLDIGEAYKYVNNEIVSLNDAVQLGTELPVLKPGSNTFTYPNTITEVKVTPRWWKI